MDVLATLLHKHSYAGQQHRQFTPGAPVPTDAAQLRLKPDCYRFAKAPLPTTNCSVPCAAGHPQGRRVPPSSQGRLRSSCCSWIPGVCHYIGPDLPASQKSEIYLQVFFVLKHFYEAVLSPTHFILGSLFSHTHSGNIKACQLADRLLSFWERCYLLYFFAHLLLEVLTGISEVIYHFPVYEICLQAIHRIRNRPVIFPEW